MNNKAEAAIKKSSFIQPEVISEIQLYQNSDRKRLGRNLVAESSAARLDRWLYTLGR